MLQRVPRPFAKGKTCRGSRNTAHVRHRHRATIHLQHFQCDRRPNGAAAWLKSSATGKEVIPIERIARAILIIRREKVMLDSDLATLYGVATGNLNKAVKRNAEEVANLKFQFGI